MYGLLSTPYTVHCTHVQMRKHPPAYLHTCTLFIRTHLYSIFCIRDILLYMRLFTVSFVYVIVNVNMFTRLYISIVYIVQCTVYICTVYSVYMYSKVVRFSGIWLTNCYIIYNGIIFTCV